MHNVEKGIQSALGQVATQLLNHEFNNTRVSDKLFQVERNLEKSQSSVAAVPSPVVVPVTVNLESVIRQAPEPPVVKQPAA